MQEREGLQKVEDDRLRFTAVEVSLAPPRDIRAPGDQLGEPPRALEVSLDKWQQINLKSFYWINSLNEAISENLQIPLESMCASKNFNR